MAVFNPYRTKKNSTITAYVDGPSASNHAGNVTGSATYGGRNSGEYRFRGVHQNHQPQICKTSATLSQPAKSKVDAKNETATASTSKSTPQLKAQTVTPPKKLLTSNGSKTGFYQMQSIASAPSRGNNSNSFDTNMAQNVKPPHQKEPNHSKTASSSSSRKELSHPIKTASSSILLSHTDPSNKTISLAKSLNTMSSTASQPKRAKQPKTLKAQLKSQIQQLHRQKKQILLLKEKQKLEAERARQKLEKDKELQRIQQLKEKQREEARRAKELERSRKEVERKKRDEERKAKQEECQRRIREEACRKSMTRMITAVEKRISLEARTRLVYGVSEAMDYLIKEVEKRVGVDYHLQLSQYHRQQIDFMNPWVEYSYQNISSWNPYGHGNDPFFTSYPSPFPTHPYRSYCKPYYYAPPKITVKPLRPLPSSTSKPLILHSNPVGDPYSPFHASHRVFQKKVIMVKCSMNDSFGVVLRLDCKSALVPREEGVKSKNDAENIVDKAVVVKTRAIGAMNDSNRDKESTYTSGSKEFSPSPNVECANDNNKDKASTYTSVSKTFSSSPNVECANGACGNEDSLSSTKKMTNNALTAFVNTDQSRPLSTSPISANSASALSSMPETASIATSSIVSNQIALSNASSLSKTPKRRRRRRINYNVITVVEVKNTKFAVQSISHDNQVIISSNAEFPMLQTGDIILSVNGKNLGGMTFEESCSIIGSSSKPYIVTPENESLESAENAASVVCCVLEIARAIPTEAPKMEPKVPPVSSQGQNVNNEKDVTTELCETVSIAQQHPAAQQIQSANAIPFRISNALATPATHDVSNQTSVLPNVAVAEETLVPFVVSGMKVTSGEFSVNEWGALISGFIKTLRQLSTGMALIPVNTRDVLLTIKSSDSLGKIIRRRGIDALEAKLLHEGKMVEAEMSIRAEKYWEDKWNVEVHKDAGNENNQLFGRFLTDANRNILRSMERPSKGCKCGSISHDLVNHPQCVLFRDVKAFTSPEISTADERKRLTFSHSSKNKKPKTLLEAAYIDRFLKLRAENDAQKEEAKFVLEMEKKQAAEMKMAVFAPGTLCVMVLSAIAVVNEFLPDVEEAECMKDVKTANDEVDEDHDSDIPLAALIGSGGLKRSHSSTDTFPIKRPKIENKELPSSYFLAKILEHISRAFGHLFQEPSHAEYSWQQRHRSVLTKPLPKDVMFRGNPRQPGALSYENIRFLLDQDRMTRLRSAWEKSNLDMTPAEIEIWNDEWIVTYLSSDKITGLRHEIDVMETLDLIAVKPSGRIVLQPFWEKRVPHMILNDMKEGWGTEADPHNLYCIHPSVKSALETAWERVDDDGWRYANHSDAFEEDDEVVFDDDEYFLRKQIFEENFNDYVNEYSGVGNFGI